MIMEFLLSCLANVRNKWVKIDENNVADELEINADVVSLFK